MPTSIQIGIRQLARALGTAPGTAAALAKDLNLQRDDSGAVVVAPSAAVVLGMLAAAICARTRRREIITTCRMALAAFTAAAGSADRVILFVEAATGCAIVLRVPPGATSADPAVRALDLSGLSESWRDVFAGGAETAAETLIEAIEAPRRMAAERALLDLPARSPEVTA